MREALIVWGGWSGHEPEQGANIIAGMLEEEGFACEGYVDIFDGGPTMTCATDRVRTVREAGESVIEGIGVERGHRAILSAGRLAEFRATLGEVSFGGGFAIDEQAANALGVQAGDTVLHAAR